MRRALYLAVIDVLIAIHATEKIETITVVDVNYLLRTNGLANDSLREHPFFSAPVTSFTRRKRSDDRKYVCGSQATQTKNRFEI